MLDKLMGFVKQQIGKRRVALETEIRDTYDELSHVGMHGKATWDMYSTLHQKYISLQAKHLSKYGTYYKEGNVGREFERKV